MDNDDLERVLAPPPNPVETGSREGWEQAERMLGVALPAGYKSFITTYGTGAINDFFCVLNPFAERPYYNLIEEGRLARSRYLAVRAMFPDHFPFRVFPEPGGLLPWGDDTNGDELYWLTEGDPDHWPVVFHEVRSWDYCRYSLTFAGFWVALLTRKLDCPFIPGVFLWDAPRFRTVAELGG